MPEPWYQFCINEIRATGKPLNSFEKDFLASVEARVSAGGSLSPKQENVLRKMHEKKNRDRRNPMTLKTVLVALIALALTTPAFAAIDESRAIKAIIGESAKETYKGQLAVAHAIRNRGHLRGVHGLKKWKSRSTPAAWQRASRAWAESQFTKDPTRGATHWENVGLFGWPWWSKDMDVTARIGKHVFFRERK